jgi:Tol biopolymer transport system component
MLLRRAVCLLAIALVAPLLAAPSTGAAGPGLIAYEALSGGVFTIRPDGTENREILPGAARPAWSPAGTRLLYGGGDGAVWSARADGTAGRRIVGPQDLRSRFPADAYAAGDGTWSPSGRRIAFVASSEDADERSVLTIGTVRVDGSGLRRLRAGMGPEWLPGGRIAFTMPARSRTSNSNRIAVMRPDGRGRRMLLGDARGYRSDLAVSPDGRRLAFIESGSLGSVGLPGLRVMDLRTRRLKSIPVSRTGPVHGLDWTPGGTRIAFFTQELALGQRVPPSSAYTIRPDGTGRKRLFTLPFEEHRGLWAEALSWQPPQ